MDPPYDDEVADKFLEMLENGDFAFIITDASRPDNPIVQLSPQFTRLTGYDRHDCLGKNPRILQGKDTDKNTVEKISKHIKHSQEDGRFLLRNFKKNGDCFWNMLYLAPVLEEKIERSLNAAPSYKVTRWIGVLTDVSELVHFYQRKPFVQGVINVSKFLLNDLKLTLTLLGPIFGSPEWNKETVDLTKIRGDAYNTNALHPDDEYMGSLSVSQSFGDICFGTAEDDKSAPRSPISIIAGPEGCQCIVMSRAMWMSAHAMEPVRFLRSMTKFAETDNHKLGKLAVYMMAKAISFRQPITRQGKAAHYVYLVKSGQLSVRIHVDELGNPLPVKPLTKAPKAPVQYGMEPPEPEDGPEEEDQELIKLKKEKKMVKEVALIGPLDAYDEVVYLGTEAFYTADVIAVTEDVLVYEISRKMLEKIMGQDFRVHTKAVEQDRQKQRVEYVDSMASQIKDAKKLMEVPNTVATGEWLGWEGYGRLPKIDLPRGSGASISPVPQPSPEAQATKSPRFSTQVSPRREHLPAIDPKRRSHEQQLEKVQHRHSEFSHLGKKGSQNRLDAVETVLMAERQRLSQQDKFYANLQVNRHQKGGPRSSSVMDSLLPSKTKLEVPGRRSSSVMLTHPVDLKRVEEWPCIGGAKQVINLSSLGKRLSGTEKRKLQRKLRNTVQPSNSTASMARGRGRAYG